MTRPAGRLSHRRPRSSRRVRPGPAFGAGSSSSARSFRAGSVPSPPCSPVSGRPPGRSDPAMDAGTEPGPAGTTAKRRDGGRHRLLWDGRHRNAGGGGDPGSGHPRTSARHRLRTWSPAAGPTRHRDRPLAPAVAASATGAAACGCSPGSALEASYSDVQAAISADFDASSRLAFRTTSRMSLSLPMRNRWKSARSRRSVQV